MRTVPGGASLGRLLPATLFASSLAFLLAIAGLHASAAGAVEGTSEPEVLVVNLDYVVPEYKGGEKFRSAATIDTAIAEDLARRLQRPFAASGGGVASDPAASAEQGSASVRSGPDKKLLRLTTLRDLAVIPPGFAVVPVGYRAAPMAIMRNDTTIRQWEQLEDRKVCVAHGGNHVGTIADRYGAAEQIHPSVTDALVALRIGACDAMVHDSPMLEELLGFPEWKKFSAQLRSGRRSTLAFLVPADEKESLSRVSRVVKEWRSDAFPEALVKNTVRNMAFEVYLEQDVPDCH